MQAGLLRRKFNRRLIFGDGVHMPVRFGIGLSKNLMHTPRLWIGAEHALVTSFGDKEVSATAVIQDVYIVRSQLVGLVERRNCFSRTVGREFNDSDPHP